MKQGKSEDQDVGRQVTNLQTSASGVRDRGCLVHVETGNIPDSSRRAYKWGGNAEEDREKLRGHRAGGGTGSVDPDVSLARDHASAPEANCGNST